MAEFGEQIPRCVRLATGAIAIALSIALTACAGGLAGGVTTDAAPSADKPSSIAELNKAGPLGEKTLGNPGAPVTVIEYVSLGCPVCSAFHKQAFPQIKTTYIDTGKVYFIFREFPIGNSPAAAAQAARCVPDKHYFRINDKFMANHGQWNGRDPDPDLLYKIVQETGLKRAEFDSCMANQNTKDGIKWVKQRGRELGVKGTPTFFINGQPVREFNSFDEMRKVIDQHLLGAAKPA